MALFASSYIPTVATTVTRNAEAPSFTFASIPEAMTFYLRFIEAGTIVGANGLRLLEIASNASGNPRFQIKNNSNLYAAAWLDATGFTLISTVGVAPTLGQVVELLVTCSAGGSLQCTQIINANDAAASIGAASGTRTFPQAWSGTTLWLNQAGNASNIGSVAFKELYCTRGVQPLATMRRLAGVN